MLREIEELAALAPNWDGYGADKFAAETLRHADCILRGLRQRYDVEVTPNPNATVTLEWDWDSEHYILEIGKSLISGCVKANKSTQ